MGRPQRAGGQRIDLGVAVDLPRDHLASAASSALAAAAVAIALGYFPALASPFVEPKLAVLVVAGALGFAAWALAAARSRGALPRWALRRWPLPRWDRPVMLAAGAFGLALVLSALFAVLRRPPGAPYAADELVRTAAVIGVALGAGLAARSDPRNRRRLLEAISAAAGLVALVGLLQHLRLSPLAIPTISVPGSTFGNRNVGAEAVAMAIPFGLGLLPFGERRRDTPRFSTVAIAIALVLEAAYLAVARARGAWLGGALGLVVFFALRRPHLSRAALTATLAVTALALLAAVIPGRWTAHDSLDAKRFQPATRLMHDAVDPTSPVAHTRLGLWRRTLALYDDHPLVGIGPGNFAVLFPRHAEPNASEDGVLSPAAVPRRAHNDLLERLAESGPLGLAAWLALYAALGAAALRRARADRSDGGAAACAGALAAFFGCGLTGFPFAMPATLFLFGVALGLLAVDGPPPAAVPARNHGPAALAGAALLGAVVVVAAGWWSARSLEASYCLARAEAALAAGDSAGNAVRALPFLDRAAEVAPRDFRVAFRASYAELRAGHPVPAARAAERALAIEPYSANAWEALARARLDAGDARGAGEAAGRALEILHAFPGALYTRARAAAHLGDGAGADEARAHLAALAATDGDARNLLAELAETPPRATGAPGATKAAP
jgi:O-antigen ligase